MSSNFFINDTSHYHITDLETLGWEMTISSMLEDAASPVRTILTRNETFGNHLLSFLEASLPFKNIHSILEVGGGYGYVMRDILQKHPQLKTAMLDISPILLSKQKETLHNHKVIYIEKNFFNCENSFIDTFDCILFNENIGDFPTIANISKDHLHASCDQQIFDTIRIIDTYELKLAFNSKNETNINIGALLALEKICKRNIPFIYMSEHSCEAATPDAFKGKVDINPSEIPERISLKGHDEYTINFSHLESIGHFYGYTIKRGQYIDFIDIEMNDKINFILTSCSSKEEHEVIRHFVEDLIKYEFLILCRAC